MIVDSDIIINYTRGVRASALFLDKLTDQGEAETHTMVAAEVLTGAANAVELRQYRRVLSGFRMVAPNEADAAPAPSSC